MRKILVFVALCAIATFPAEYIMDHGDSRSENLIVTAILAGVGLALFLVRNKISPKRDAMEYRNFNTNKW